jgi:hypothetical protein
MTRVSLDSYYIKAAYKRIDRVYKEQGLKPEEKHEKSVSLFDSWHIAQCNEDHAGFRGKIT